MKSRGFNFGINRFKINSIIAFIQRDRPTVNFITLAFKTFDS